MKALRPLFQAGLGGKLGNGQQWVSWIDVRDLARLFLFAIENPDARGVLNATSPHPVRNAEFTQALADKFHRKAWLCAPASVLKGLLGEASHVLLDSQRILPRRAQDLGFQWQVTEL
jgi:NAD dependent epimerase/dehydratase family enzyme